MNERGQATVETLAIVPICLLCAWMLVEVGVAARDRVAIAQAASRAAVAQEQGQDPAVAARSALDGRLARTVAVRADSRAVRVSARSNVRLLKAVGAGRVSSRVELQVGGGR